MPSGPSGHVSIAMGLQGPVFGVTSACASGNHAFISAVDQIRLGRADVMLAGGAELALVYGPLKAWESLRVLARSVCRPFSADRDGLVLGDGAAIAVLESYEHARARGANILAEIIGVGMSGDASDIVNPTVEGPAAAMRNCLADAGISADQVDYINAHGTATQTNDQTETRVIRDVFGAVAKTVSVSSTKSMHGHCLGASSAIEMIACVNAMREGVIPPTINYATPDPVCDLDVTPNVAREKQRRCHGLECVCLRRHQRGDRSCAKSETRACLPELQLGSPDKDGFALSDDTRLKLVSPGRRGALFARIGHVDRLGAIQRFGRLLGEHLTISNDTQRDPVTLLKVDDPDVTHKSLCAAAGRRRDTCPHKLPVINRPVEKSGRQHRRQPGLAARGYSFSIQPAARARIRSISGTGLADAKPGKRVNHVAIAAQRDVDMGKGRHSGSPHETEYMALGHLRAGRELQ
jgi:hypothetical protein